MSFYEFLQLEMNEIKTYKWIESEKAGYDLGFIAEIEWVTLYAKTFREDIEKKYGEIRLC